MPIQDTDLLLIQDTSGNSRKIAALKLKQELPTNTYNNYKLLVNKSDYTSRFVYAQNMQASVATSDYMMVERNGTSFKVTGQQIIDYFPSLPSGVAGYINGVTSSTLTLDADTNLSDFTNGDALTMVDSNGDAASYIPVTNNISNVSSVTTYEDSIGTGSFENGTEVNLVNGTGNTAVGFKETTNQQNSAWTFYPSVSGNVVSFYLSNDSSSSTRSGEIRIQGNGPELRQNISIGPGANVSFTTSLSDITFIWIKQFNVVNERINISNFRINGNLVNLPTQRPVLTFSSNNTDLKYFNVNDSINSGAATIKEINVPGNTMTLSGGSWSTGNTITGPAKTGTATFNSNSTTTVNISNSNGQWIANDNRLGTEFYIRSSSFRTGLAVLRQKAISAATAWSSSTNYSIENFVTYNGNYWVAVESNINDSPDGSDTTWIDLGAV